MVCARSRSNKGLWLSSRNPFFRKIVTISRTTRLPVALRRNVSEKLRRVKSGRKHRYRSTSRKNWFAPEGVTLTEPLVPLLITPGVGVQLGLETFPFC